MLLVEQANNSGAVKLWKMPATGSKLLLPTICKFLAIFCIIITQNNVAGNVNPTAIGVHRRFEYKYSFKPPYLAQKDGTVPFWEYGGSK